MFRTLRLKAPCSVLQDLWRVSWDRYGISVSAVAPGAIVSEVEARVVGLKAEDYNKWILESQS